MEHNEGVCYSLLKRYFYGETTSRESEQVEVWLRDPKNKFRTDQFLSMLWGEIENGGHTSSFDQESILDKIHHRINLQSKGLKSGPRSLKRSGFSTQRLINRMSRIAAILLLPIMLYFAWEVFSQRMWLNSQKKVVYHEIKCPLGATSRFVLPDGTRGSLNNGSKLKYPVEFRGDTRKVELKGEAYFDVKHNKKRPFIIQTHGLDVRVTGTRLNVYAYPDDDYQQFTLESGAIELIKGCDDRMVSIAKMKPGQHAIYMLKEGQIDLQPAHKKTKNRVTKTVNHMKKLEAKVMKMKPDERIVHETEDGKIEFQYEKDIEQYSSWKDGMLVLRNDPMPVLLKRIERWYHVKFNVLDKGINEYTYWATFEQENLEEVLELLSLTGPIAFKKHPRKKNEQGHYQPQVIDVCLEK